MYNRYIRNDNGEYRRVPHREPSPPPEDAHGEPEFFSSRKFSPDQESDRDRTDSFLRKLLDRLHLEDVDTGDLLLLLLLLLLFSEGEDEELLIALGLLLIL